MCPHSPHCFSYRRGGYREDPNFCGTVGFWYYVELSTIDKHLMRMKRYGVNLELQAKVCVRRLWYFITSNKQCGPEVTHNERLSINPHIESTLFCAVSGFTHFGSMLAASMRRNSPSESEILKILLLTRTRHSNGTSTCLTTRSSKRSLNLNRMYTISHSSSTLSRKHVCPNT